MSGRVRDKLIVVTGAARGQGEAEAAKLAAEGATVIACDIASGSGPAGPDPGPGVVSHPLDVADPESWETLRAHIAEHHGRVDGLINNAGVTSRVRLPDVELDDWNRVLAVNLTGPMLGIKTLLPLMPEGSSIVNVGSVAGLTGHYTAAYTASKWGLRGLTRTAATELGARGIRVNAVHPGYIHTPMTAGAPETFYQANVDVTPLSRGGQPDEVADLMVFLMSDESRFLSGADIPIDGGQVAGGIAKFMSDAVRRAGT
ncbi:MAG TPA: SDR family oxidoreductase [Solirubrobacteraceae bacterium]|jgi:3alpha(or 20beta)-hydroxysteroid dehydrogenase|nr:SDR family oxidoreductase [Solirubrobacteraceae bacterium]